MSARCGHCNIVLIPAETEGGVCQNCIEEYSKQLEVERAERRRRENQEMDEHFIRHPHG